MSCNLYHGIRVSSERILVGASLSWLILAVALLVTIVSTRDSNSAERKPEQKKESKNYLNLAEIAQMEASILRFTNEERVRNGLKALKASDALIHISKKQSKHMCDSQVLAHEDDAFPNGWRKLIQRLKLISVRSGAENIALRTVESNREAWAREIVTGWMKSPPHKRNILEPTHRYIGVGVEPCARRIAYVTQTFSSDVGTVP